MLNAVLVSVRGPAFAVARRNSKSAFVQRMGRCARVAFPISVILNHVKPVEIFLNDLLSVQLQDYAVVKNAESPSRRHVQTAAGTGC